MNEQPEKPEKPEDTFRPWYDFIRVPVLPSPN
jgi:hypothetical protein